MDEEGYIGRKKRQREVEIHRGRETYSEGGRSI